MKKRGLLNRRSLRLAWLILAVAAAGPCMAQAVVISEAWARATVPGQRASGVFMKIKAREPVRLMSVFSPVAVLAEVHQMAVEDGVMTMRAVEGGLALPSGKTLEFKSGGYHLMLLDLKQPLVANTVLPLTLVLRDAQGKISRTSLQVPVTTSAPPSTAMQ